MKPALRVLLPDPLLFAALAVAAQRVQSGGHGRNSHGWDLLHEGGADIVSFDFSRNSAHLTLGLLTGEIEYEIDDDRVTLRGSGGSEVMIFALAEGAH